MSGSPLVVARGVRRRYASVGEVDALDGLDLTIDSGQMVALTGPSGSGKTTALGIIGLLDLPSEGSVLIGGIDASTYGERQRSRMRAEWMGFVFQHFNLIASLTALANVETALLYRGLSPRERRSRALDTLALVGLGHRCDHKPDQMSGGEQQRVAVARAVVSNPRLILADEPTGDLDSENAEMLVEILRRFTSNGVAVLIATHDPEVAAAADRRLVMRDGRINGET